MGKVIEVIYENGVIKPLKSLNLPDRTRLVITIEERDEITEEFLNELSVMLGRSRKIQTSRKKMDETFCEGKMLH